MGSKKDLKQASSPGEPTRQPWLHAVRALLLSAMVITAYLALVSLSRGGEAPGCGPDSSCDKVLTSSWAYWLGVPISLPGLGLYALFLVHTFLGNSKQPDRAKRALNTQTLCAFSILAAALWFVGIQAFAIGSFCPYCCTAHALASMASLLFLMKANALGARLSVRLNFLGGAIAGLLFVALIAGTQVLFPRQQPGPAIVEMKGPPAETTDAPEPQEVAIDSSNSTSVPPETKEEVTDPAPADEVVPPSTETNAAPVAVHEEPSVALELPTPEETNNVVTPPEPFVVPKSTIKLDPTRLATLGTSSTPNRIGLMFDYTCHHCRKLHGYIRTLLTKYEGRLSCMMIPVPLAAKCNRRIAQTHPDHVNACEYALICLSVQHLDPSKYDAFDAWLFSDHHSAKPLETVRQHVEALFGPVAFEAAYRSPEVLDQLKQNLQVYESNYRNSGKTAMPQTIVRDGVIFGPAPSAEALEKYLIQLLKL